LYAAFWSEKEGWGYLGGAVGRKLGEKGYERKIHYSTGGVRLCGGGKRGRTKMTTKDTVKVESYLFYSKNLGRRLQ